MKAPRDLFSYGESPGYPHVETLKIYKLDSTQNYYTFASILLIKIVMSSNFQRTKFMNHKVFHMNPAVRGRSPSIPGDRDQPLVQTQ